MRPGEGTSTIARELALTIACDLPIPVMLIRGVNNLPLSASIIFPGWLYAGSDDGEDRRQACAGRFRKGLALFCAICSIGGMANLDVAAIADRSSNSWALAGLAGAPIGAVLNFAISAA